MRLPVELLEDVALYLLAESCPEQPRRPPISGQAEIQQHPSGVLRDVGELWDAPAKHPVRRLSQVNSVLRNFVRERMWRIVYIQDINDLRVLERLYRYLRCVDCSVLARWTREMTYSAWASHWDERGGPGSLGELYWGRPNNVEDADENNQLPVDAAGFIIVEEGKELLDWPAGKPWLDKYEPTRADVWALHRFVFQQLQSVERVCWRAMVDPGTMFRGSSLMHVIAALPKLRVFQVDQSYTGGWFYARSFLPLGHLEELWIDCDCWFPETEPDDEWMGDPGQPSIDGEPLVADVDHRKRFLTRADFDRLVTTHFDCFDDPDVLAALACVEVVAREPVDGHNRQEPEDLELGQAVAHLRPALLAFATPGKLTAQHVRKAASSDPRLARIREVLEGAAETVARRFNVRAQ